MYTSKKRLKEMMKDAATFLGVATANEVLAHASKARVFFERKLGKHGFDCVQLSPYKDGEWLISGIIPSETRFFFKTLELEDWMDSPSQTASMIIDQYCKS